MASPNLSGLATTTIGLRMRAASKSSEAGSILNWRDRECSVGRSGSRRDDESDGPAMKVWRLSRLKKLFCCCSPCLRVIRGKTA